MKKWLFILIGSSTILVMSSFHYIKVKQTNAAQTATMPTPSNSDNLVDCLVKVKSNWGEVCNQCENSNDTYVVYIKNKCDKKLDVMIGVQEAGQWWRLSTFYGVNSSDTLRVYACKGTGKYLKWARLAGDKSYEFPTQTEVNEKYK